MWTTVKEVKEKLKICDQTLNNWRRSNKILFKKVNSRNFLYDFSSLAPFSNIEENKKHVIYSRVSNTKQFNDLKRQIQLLQELTNDLVSIIHHFSMKLYSNRRKVLKELKKSF